MAADIENLFLLNEAKRKTIIVPIEMPQLDETLKEPVDKTIVYGQDLHFLAKSTIVLEFENSMGVFFSLVPQLYPELMYSIYKLRGELMQAINKAFKYNKFDFYLKNSGELIKRIFHGIYVRARKLDKKGRFNQLTNNQAIDLFDINHPKCLINLYKEWNTSIRLPKEIPPFYKLFMALNIINLYLHQIISKLVIQIVGKITTDGPLANFKAIDLLEIVSSISFVPKQISPYLDAISYQILNQVNEGIFMKLTFMNPLENRIRPQLQHVGFQILSMNDGDPRNAWTVFERSDFMNHGLDINTTVKTARGVNGLTAMGCDNSGSQCGVIIKIAHVHIRESLIMQAAASLGLGPLLIVDPFNIVNVDSSRPAFLRKYPNPSRSRSWTVYAMNRITATFGNMMEMGEITVQDVKAVVALLQEFEFANFVHHDMKSDNIMVKIDQYGRRRWYIIDFGVAWYGGPKYNPDKPPSPVNLPYGWNYETNSVITPNGDYRGWSRTTLFTEPPPSFDVCCLAASVTFMASKYDPVKTMVLNTMLSYSHVKKHLRITPIVKMFDVSASLEYIEDPDTPVPRQLRELRNSIDMELFGKHLNPTS